MSRRGAPAARCAEHNRGGPHRFTLPAPDDDGMGRCDGAEHGQEGHFGSPLPTAPVSGHFMAVSASETAGVDRNCLAIASVCPTLPALPHDEVAQDAHSAPCVSHVHPPGSGRRVRTAAPSDLEGPRRDSRSRTACPRTRFTWTRRPTICSVTLSSRATTLGGRRVHGCLPPMVAPHARGDAVQRRQLSGLPHAARGVPPPSGCRTQGRNQP